MLFQCIYISKATEHFSEEELQKIMRSAYKNNESSEITGVLLYDKGFFMQVLEGDEKKVRETLARITADIRHTELRILMEQSIAEREFPKWSLALLKQHSKKLTSQYAKGIEEVNIALWDTPAKRFIDMFQSGVWHDKKTAVG